jgi:hypothetical protein
MKSTSYSAKGKNSDPVAKPSRRAADRTVLSEPYASFLAIQSAVGNRALSKLLESAANPLTPTAGNSPQKPPHRPHIARQTAGALLQRKCACGGNAGITGECEDCRKKRLQRKAMNGSVSREVPPIVHEVLSAPGHPLDTATRAFFEPRFGRDLSHIRVHTDGRAEQSACAMDAWAYTVGRKVVFGPGKYAPRTRDGRYLLAHELTHVMQQGGEQPLSFAVSDPNGPAEREAEDSARMLTREGSAQFRPTRVTGVVLARYQPPPPIVRPPPRAPPGTARPPGVVPRSGPTQAPGAQPGPTSFDEGYERLKEENASAARALRELERPVATLDRGGTPPHFITVLPERIGQYTGQTGGTFHVKYRPHRFHILDAIEYAVAQAKTTEELNDVRARYIDPSTVSYGFFIPRILIQMESSEGACLSMP